MNRSPVCPLVAAVAIAMSHSAGAVPPVLTLHIVQAVAHAPVLDGKLDDACWQQAPRNSTFYQYGTPSAAPTISRTAFQMCYDAKGLYLGISLAETNMAKLKATITQRDDPTIWTDDSVELYFDSDAMCRGYRNFTINALGAKADRLRMDAANSDASWSPDGWQVATSRDDKGWTIEAFFPWDNLGKRATDGDLWRFCMARFSWSSGALSVSSVGGNYNSPERFGWLLFLNAQGGDATALAEQLKARVPGDWLLPLQDKAIEKMSGQARVTSMPEILRDLRRQADVQLAECRTIAEGDAEGVKAADQVGKDLAAVNLDTQDAIVFQQSVGALAKLGEQMEHVKYSVLLRRLYRDAAGGSGK
jgi:hypothetical protein